MIYLKISYPIPTHSRHNLIALLSTVAASPRKAPAHSITVPTAKSKACAAAFFQCIYYFTLSLSSFGLYIVFRFAFRADFLEHGSATKYRVSGRMICAVSDRFQNDSALFCFSVFQHYLCATISFVTFQICYSASVKRNIFPAWSSNSICRGNAFIKFSLVLVPS